MRPWWESRTKGIYIYSLSPFEQKAFHGFFRHDLKELLYRGLKGSRIIFPIALSGYGLIYWANKSYHKRCLKNPDDYLTEEEVNSNNR